MMDAMKLEDATSLNQPSPSPAQAAAKNPVAKKAAAAASDPADQPLMKEEVDSILEILSVSARKICPNSKNPEGFLDSLQNCVRLPPQ